MNLFHKKLSLHFYVVIVLWCLIVLASVGVFAVLVAAGFSHWTGHKLSDAKTMIFTILISEAVLIALWRISTFGRRDLVRIMKREGVQVKKRNPLFLLVTSWIWSFPQGTLGDSYVIAKIYGAYDLPTALGKRTNLTPESVLTDRMDFISLISGQLAIDEEIRIEKTNRIVPNTGVTEIDAILQETLRDAEDFRARLIFNNEYFRLILISSPWLGGRYEKRVIKGFEIFKRIDEALKKKYPHKKWEGLEMKWNGWKLQFEPVRVTA